MLNIKIIFTSIIFFLFTQPAFAYENYVFVVGVIDGDTIKVAHNGAEMRVRLYGIDCPEKGQAYGPEAKEFVKMAVAHKNVLVKIKGRDRYGRVVAIIIYDNKSLNEDLLRAGLAWHFKKYSKEKSYADIEAEAKRERRGLWSGINPSSPHDYRSGVR